jgi:EmrB/QacA subfamily drug resistance transporter
VPSDRPDVISRRAWTVLVLAGVGSMLPAINLSVMYVVYPEIARAFPSVTSAQLSWILNGYTIVSAATLVLGGVFSDRTGRKRSMLIGAALFGGGSVLCALAPNVAVIIAGRFVIGIAASLVVTASTSLALREFPASRRSTAFGVLSSFGGIAAAAGPSLGAIIVDLGGWRWAFWLNVPIAAIVIVGGAKVFAESRDESVRHFPDPVGAAVLMLGVGAGILALVQSPTWGWLDGRTDGCLALSAFLLAVLIARSARHRAPIVELTLFRHRNFSLLNLSSFLVSVGWFGMYFVLIQFLRNSWGYSLLEAGLLVTPIPFGAGVLAPLGGRVADRVGYRSMLAVGAAAFVIGALWLIVMVDETPDVPMFMVGIVFVAIGTGLVFPSVQGGTVVGMAPDRYAMAAGLNQAIQRVGSAIGNALGVVFVSSVGASAAFDRIYLVLLAASLLILPAAFALRSGTELSLPRAQQVSAR